MHWVIPFAAPLADAGRAALGGLRWPQLSRLLAHGGAPLRDEGDEWSLTPPHERALARAWGWPAAPDGQVPMAAWWAAQDGLATGSAAWGLVTPAYWHLGTEQVSLTDPQALGLDEAASRALLEAVRGLFEGDGFHIAYGAPLRWYLSHPDLADLPTASLDRVVGRNVDRWLGAGAAQRRVRRLQSEVQMLLHTHPLNADREARGQHPVNSFWLSGCGPALPVPTGGLVVDDRLRAPALAEDWPAWAAAWSALDAELGERPPRRLTLCGERASCTYDPAAPGWATRLLAPWRRADVAAVLGSL